MRKDWLQYLDDSPVKPLSIASPPAFSTERSKRFDTISHKQESENETLKIKKAWEVALAPVKGLPMNLFMSYMSGNSLQLVPIMMTSVMFFVNPLKQIAAANQSFLRFQSDNNSAQINIIKLVYVLCHCLTIGVGVWKLSQMGLLPVTKGDWLAFESPARFIETVIW